MIVLLLYYSLDIYASMATRSLSILAICMVSVLLIESTVSMKIRTLSNSRRFVFGWRRQISSSSSCIHHPSSTLFISSPSLSTKNKNYQKNVYAYPRYITPRSSIHKTKSSPLQMTSFTSASTQEGINISIEYCSACRWMLRSNWILSELLTTFAYEDKLVSISLIPQGPPLSDGGIFRLYASNFEGGDINHDKGNIVLWDRKVNGRFPESKEVKQLVRDVCNPYIDLGHSDVNKVENVDNIANSKEEADDCIECKEEQESEQKSTQKSTVAEDQTNGTQQQHEIPNAFYKQNHISIEYSVGSSIESPDNGLYQATYYANEILSMIYERNVWWKKKQQQQEEKNSSNDDDDIPAAVDRVSVIPNRIESGILRVKLNDDRVLYDQLSDENSAASIMSGRHLRDIISTAIVDSEDNSNEMVFEMMSDDEAEEARKYFGVF